MNTGKLLRSIIILAVCAAFPVSLTAVERTTISLNGTWDIEDSKEADAMPSVWRHTVPVPGLAHSAQPAFPQVDQFDSRMVIQNRVSNGKLPKSALVSNAGVSRQQRNWFWYRRKFETPAPRSVAILRINKAQFGAVVWLNGTKIGDHLPCFTAAVFDVSRALRQGDNELIVRVGAHPGVLPPTALILNEYGWLWLNRDGTPTELTKNLYPALLGKNSTPQERLALNAYLLAGLTEYWRAYRQYAGVLHFVYLTSSDPAGYTSDHFRDVRNLELHPEFRDYMSNAFAPVGVYLSFWQSKTEAASERSLPVMLVNDEDRSVDGTLTVALETKDGTRVATQTTEFKISPLGQDTIYSNFKFPDVAGDFLLKAIIDYRENNTSVSTQSRRYVKLVKSDGNRE